MEHLVMALLEPLQQRLRVVRLEPTVIPRRLLLLGIDVVLISFSFWAAIALRVVNAADRERHLASQLYLLPWAVGIGVGVLAVSGWYRSLVRASGSHSFYGLLPRSGVVVLGMLVVSELHGVSSPPRSFWVLFWLLFATTTICSRILLRDLLRLRLPGLAQQAAAIDPVHPVATMIYGAGDAGLSLLEALRFDRRFAIKAVLDDDPALWGRRLRQLRIAPPREAAALQRRHGITQVLLAMPSVSRHRKRQRVSALTALGLKVLEMPSLAQIASGERRVSELRPLAIEDLLGREPSIPDPALLARAVAGKSVLVSGAGGSIGSELCRQILQLGPARLVLLERNEFALYATEQQLHELACQRAQPVPLEAVLGDVGLRPRLEALLREHQVEVLFHAAAYKHVPLLEHNVCSGLANNVLGTRVALEAALACGLERFTLISTDKAVRPTNAMGASKRVCELLVQEAAARPGVATICAMVRFGNVLGSSGSVVPRFRQQLAAGGPLTVTHPEITRYFMTMGEAAALVIQAAGMAAGGEVFVLDMGEPVRIVELARQMIELSGYSVRDEHRPQGDIPIVFTGLRPGEKLYEELLIAPTDQPTSHPLIRKAMEAPCSTAALQQAMVQLEEALLAWNDEAALAALRRLVPDYAPVAHAG